MEHSLPPVIEPEPLFDTEAAAKKKPRWNVFEMFRKREPESETPETTPQQTEAEPAETPARRRRFGEAIIQLFKGETAKKPPEPAETYTNRAPAVPERHVATVSETAPPFEPIIERAQEMGRGVLGLLRRVRRDVLAADTHERVERPTDIQPLDEADAQVRAAMQELIAPIEAYAAERGISSDTSGLRAEQPPLPATALQPEQSTKDWGGSDTAPQPTFAGRSPMLDAAFAAVTSAAEYMSDRAERHRERHTRLGLFAVGAATVGVLVYTWRRQREIRKEQRALKKEQAHFTREMREQQQESQRHMERFEQVRVAQLSQLQRQEHVHEVSSFAVAQAEVMQTIARRREQSDVRAAVPLATVSEFDPRLETQPRTLAEAPHQTFTAGEVHSPERPTIARRALDVLRPKSSAATETGNSGNSASGGGFGGLASTLIGLTTGKAPPEPPTAQTPTPQQSKPQPRRTNQEWLLGVGLAVGIVAVLLLLMNVL